MQTSQGKTYVSLTGADAFLDENADVLAGVVDTGSRRKLKIVLAALSTHVVNQSSSALASQGSTMTQRSLRLALTREHMAPIARIARAELPTTPEIMPLRMPRGRQSGAKLVAAAGGMAKAAAPYANVFVNAGLPADFVAQLDSAATALLTALGTHETIRGRGVTATSGMKGLLSEGRKLVHVLDAYVQIALKDNPSLLAGWNSVKRVKRVGSRVALTGTTANPPTATPPSTTSTSIQTAA